MANPEHLKVLCRDERKYHPWILLDDGALVEWNIWRARNPEIVPDLSDRWFPDDTDLRVQLENGDYWTNPGLDLCGAGVDFRGANLKESSFINCNLEGANFEGADLEGANLCGAILDRVRLAGTNLASALIGGTRFLSVDLTPAAGLEDVQHRGPSTIGADSLGLSRGKIPDDFLRGCGLSDWEIEVAKLYDPQLSNMAVADLTYQIANTRAEKPIAVSRIFLSHSAADKVFVSALYAALQDQGIRCWLDELDLVAGKIEKQLQWAMALHPLLVLVLSKNSVESDWVEWEVAEARKLEKRLDRAILCPIALDDSWKSCNWSGPLRQQIGKYRILDFSNWNEQESFRREYEKLVSGLALFYSTTE